MAHPDVLVLVVTRHNTPFTSPAWETLKRTVPHACATVNVDNDDELWHKVMHNFPTTLDGHASQAQTVVLMGNVTVATMNEIVNHGPYKHAYVLKDGRGDRLANSATLRDHTLSLKATQALLLPPA